MLYTYRLYLGQKAHPTRWSTFPAKKVHESLIKLWDWIKVARYSFSGPIPPKFENKLRRHKQSFGKIATTVIFFVESLVWLLMVTRSNYLCMARIVQLNCPQAEIMAVDSQSDLKILLKLWLQIEFETRSFVTMTIRKSVLF